MIKSIKSKKAVIEIGFSWIFILIAGTVILGLFVYIGFKQGNFFKTLINADMLQDLNAIFVAAQVSKNTAAIFTIPKTDLSFSCNSYGIEGVTHSFAGQFVFAPDKIKTDKIISWSKPWSLGFRVTNFLYLTTPYIKYYIGYDPHNSDMQAMAQEMYDDFPKHVNKELLPLDGSKPIKNENYDRIIVLLLNKDEAYTPPTNVFRKNDFKSYKKDEIIFLSAVRPDIRTIDGSLITRLLFRDKEFDFIGPEAGMVVYEMSSLYGAFISGNYDQSQCMLRRAFAKAEDVVEVYSYRTMRLNNPICTFHYELAREEFIDMLSNLRGPNGNIYVDDLKYNVVQLMGLNEMLETYSCPLIY